jgi:hypothetical protein
MRLQWFGAGLVTATTAIVILSLWMLTGCAAQRPPQPSIAERCKGEPICMLIGQQVEADEAQQAQAYQPAPPQRVFIHRWVVPGARNNPAPIGYIDY